MSFIEILLIGIALSLDCLAVSIAISFSWKNFKSIDGFKTAITFGIFHMVMPILGWSAGVGLDKYITGFDHWIAVTLLSFVGIKMIIDSFKNQTKKEKLELSNVHANKLLLLAIATSIDAVAIGISLAFLKVEIISTALIISVTAFTVSFIGIIIGHKIGKFFGPKIQIVGGVVLVGIGLKILMSHLFNF